MGVAGAVVTPLLSHSVDDVRGDESKCLNDTLRTINLVHNKFGYNNFGYDNFSHKFRNHLVYNNFSQIFDFSRPLLLLFSWFILQVLAIFFKLYSPNSYFFFLVEQFTRALLSFDSS